MEPGGTLLIHDPDQGALLWVVITRSNAAGEIAIVCLAPAGPGSSDDDIIGPDDHPDVREECVARYRFATYVAETRLQRARQQGLAQLMAPCSRELLRRIQLGALASDFTELGIQRAIRAMLDAERHR